MTITINFKTIATAAVVVALSIPALKCLLTVTATLTALAN